MGNKHFHDSLGPPVQPKNIHGLNIPPTNPFRDVPKLLQISPEFPFHHSRREAC